MSAPEGPDEVNTNETQTESVPQTQLAAPTELVDNDGWITEIPRRRRSVVRNYGAQERGAVSGGEAPFRIGASTTSAMP